MRIRRLNGKLLALLTLSVVLIGAGVYALHGFQVKRNLGGLLQQAERAEEQHEPERALDYLRRYLIYKPNDAAALVRYGRLLDATAKRDKDRVQVYRVYMQVLRNDRDNQDVRRRVAVIAMEFRAVDDARENLEILVNLKPAPADLGRWEALLGQCYEVHKQYAKADAEYEKALGHAPEEVVWYPLDRYGEPRAQKPGDVALTERRAALYDGPLRDPKKAGELLDALVRDRPKSAEARLARSRFLDRAGPAGQPARARADLDEAVRLSPSDRAILLAAAAAAQRAGDVRAARFHLQAAAAGGGRDDPRYWLIQGLVAMRENHGEDAIASWREGAARAAGDPKVEIELSWRLAHALLQLGRVDDAEAPLKRYRSLAGGTEPSPFYLYLEGIRAIKSNLPVEAIKTLEAIESKISEPEMKAQLHLMLGQAYEATRDEAKALDHDRQASALAPHWPLPWLALARIAEGHGLDEAADELTRGLTQIPNDPNLLVALAQVRWREQLKVPAERRSWDALERALRRAEAVAPAAPALILTRVDYLTAQGKADEAVDVLGRAARKLNRKSAELWAAYANALVRQGKTDEAARALEQAAADDAAGDQIVLRRAKADLLVQQQHAQAAREALIKDWRKLPSTQRPLAWKALGDLNLTLRDRPGARAAYAQWAALLPSDPLPRQILLELALSGDDTASVREQIEALRGIGGPQSLYVRMARALEILREDQPGADPKARDARLKQADQEIAAVLAIAPKLATGYLLRGLLREAQGRADQAIDAYEQALQNGGGAAAMTRLIALMAEQGRFEDLAALGKNSNSPTSIDRIVAAEAVRAGKKGEAARLAAKVLREDPGAGFWVAQVYISLGQPEEAEHALRVLIARRPTEPTPWLALLVFQVGRGPDHAQDVAETLDRIKAEVKTNQPELFLAECYGIARDSKRADQAFRLALAKYPDDPMVRQAAASFEQAMGHSAEAEASLRHVLGRDPKASWAARDLAKLLSARPGDSKAWAEAWTLVKPGSAIDDSAESRLTRAVVLSRSPEPGHHREAAEQLERLAADLPVGAPTALEAHDLLAVLYLRAGEPAKAREQAALVAAPDKPVAIAAYGQILLQQGKTAEAARQLDRLVALAPGALATSVFRARVLQAQGKGPAAVAVVEKAFQDRLQTPDSAAVGRALVSLLADLGHLDEAERMGRDLAKDHPETASVLARVLAQRGRLQEALDQCQAAVAKAPREAAATAVQMVATPESAPANVPPERLEQAVAIVDEAIRLDPKWARLVVMKALLRRAQGRHDDEARLEREALALDPLDNATRNNLAWVLSEDLGQPDLALKAIDEAIGHAGRYPQFLDTRGVILARLGRLDDAIKDLREAADAIRTGPIYFHLARACRQAKRIDEARAALTKAREAGLTADQLSPVERPEWEAMRKEPALAAGGR